MDKSQKNRPRPPKRTTPEAMKELSEAAEKVAKRVFAGWSKAAKRHIT